MPLITEKQAVLEVYENAAERKWVIPTFCSENLTTTEAIMQAVSEYGQEIGQENLPVTIAITNLYEHRSQSVMYTQTRRWDIGLKLFLNDIKVLTDSGSPFEHLQIMTHLDHVQPELDVELLEWDLTDFSSIMYDASAFPWADNLKKTSDFVQRRGREIVIEGACDEIVDATGSERSDLTTPKKAEEYIKATGVDFMVANLGTEHRANAADLEYRGDIAGEIKKLIGAKMVLHGCSSVPHCQLGNLFSDGVCKVNIWTALERDSSPVLFEDMLRHVEQTAGTKIVEKLIEDGYLTVKNATGHNFDLKHFTTAYRQSIVFEEMKKVVKSFLKIWYK